MSADRPAPLEGDGDARWSLIVTLSLTLEYLSWLHDQSDGAGARLHARGECRDALIFGTSYHLLYQAYSTAPPLAPTAQLRGPKPWATSFE